MKTGRGADGCSTGKACLLRAAAACAIAAAPIVDLGAQLSMIALTALAMGLRNATVRQLKVADLTTTVLTFTIAGLAADSSFAGGRNPNFGRRALAVLAILAGAVTGALLIQTSGIALPLGLAGFGGLAATLVLTPRTD